MSIIHQDGLTEGKQVPSITSLFIFLQTGYNLQLKLNTTGYGTQLGMGTILKVFWEGKREASGDDLFNLTSFGRTSLSTTLEN